MEYRGNMEIWREGNVVGGGTFVIGCGRVRGDIDGGIIQDI